MDHRPDHRRTKGNSLDPIRRESMAALGARVFGSEVNYYKWMLEHSRLLDGHRPADLFRTKSGSFRIVETLLLLCSHENRN